MMMVMMMIILLLLLSFKIGFRMDQYGSTNILSSHVHTFCPADLIFWWLCLVSLELSAQRPSVLSCVSDLWGFCCKFLYKNLNHFVCISRGLIDLVAEYLNHYASPGEKRSALNHLYMLWSIFLKKTVIPVKPFGCNRFWPTHCCALHQSAFLLLSCTVTVVLQNKLYLGQLKLAVGVISVWKSITN